MYLFMAVISLICSTHAFSICTSRARYLHFVEGPRLLTGWLLLLRSTGSRRRGFSNCGCKGLAALWHVGFSWTRDRTWVPHIGRCSTSGPPEESLACSVRRTESSEGFLLNYCYLQQLRWSKSKTSNIWCHLHADVCVCVLSCVRLFAIHGL